MYPYTIFFSSATTDAEVVVVSIGLGIFFIPYSPEDVLLHKVSYTYLPKARASVFTSFYVEAMDRALSRKHNSA